MLKFLGKGNRIAIFIGSIVTGFIPYAAYLSSNLTTITQFVIDHNKVLNKAIKRTLLLFTRCLKFYDTVIAPGKFMYKLLKSLSLSKNTELFRNPSIPYAFSLDSSINPLHLKRVQPLTICFFVTLYYWQGTLGCAEPNTKLSTTK